MCDVVLPGEWAEWQVSELVGSGAYGTVYKAENRNGEICAIKVIQIPNASSEAEVLKKEYGTVESVNTYLSQIVQDFQSEIKALECLKSTSNVVHILDYQIEHNPQEIQWQIFIRMEYLQSLPDYQTEHGMEESDVIRLGMDICRALVKCEEKKIIHRDIKPDNIMVSPDGKFKLGDFGVARSIERTSCSLSLKGTFGFMAPEVYYGRNYNKNADIYSLGIVMYRLMNNNRPPFTDSNKKMLSYRDREQALMQRMKGDEELPAPVNASAELAEIIKTACAYDTEKRFPSAGDMLAALEALSKGKYDSRYRHQKEAHQKKDQAEHPTEKKISAAGVLQSWIFRSIIVIALAALVSAGVSVFITRSNHTSTSISVAETSSIFEEKTSSISAEETSSIPEEQSSDISAEETSSIPEEKTSSIGAEETSSIPEEKSSSDNTDQAVSEEPIVDADEVGFYGIWILAAKSYSAGEQNLQEAWNKGFSNAQLYLTTDWSNLNSKTYYVISCGAYETKEAAEVALSSVQQAYPNAYVKYSGSYIGD